MLSTLATSHVTSIIEFGDFLFIITINTIIITASAMVNDQQLSCQFVVNLLMSSLAMSLFFLAWNA
jgi:hypothetical protein